jgi:hypothetical protein
MKEDAEKDDSEDAKEEKRMINKIGKKALLARSQVCVCARAGLRGKKGRL